MTDPLLWGIAATAGLLGLLIATLAALHGWRAWLDLKRLELESRRIDTVPGTTSARIELADLRERVRKLEAIAAGVDL